MAVRFEYDFEKSFAAVLYLASDSESVPQLDKLKAAKLLFLADKYHLVRYARPILGDEYRALEWGPIPQRTIDFIHAVIDPGRAEWVNQEQCRRFAEALEIHREFRYPRLSATKSIDYAEYLSRSDLDAIQHIVATYGKLSGVQLSAITHAMPAYRKAWESRQSLEAIPMQYEDFFEDDPDAIEGALEEMLENDQLRRAFSSP